MVVELIAKDKNEKLQFAGSCKLRIDSVSKILLVEPKNEEFKMISAMFEWKFVAEKNILFVFAEHYFQDFALIFDNSKTCNKVFDCLIKREAIRGDAQLIIQRFLPPFFDEIFQNNGLNSKFKEILVDFIKKHGEKEEYIQLVKDNNIFDLCYPEGENNKRRNLRKRKAKDITNCDDIVSDYSSSFISHKSNSFISDRSSFKKRKYELNKKCKDDIVVDKSLYTIIPLISRRNVTKKYLIIFTTEENDFCYKFFYDKWNKRYQCSKCCSLNKCFYFSAKIQNEGKENEIVYLNNRKHICEPFKYSDILRASNRQTVMAPNYQLIKRKRNGKIFQHLVVFTNDEKSECFEYTWCEQRKKFICFACKKRNKIHVYARIIKNEETEEECIKLFQNEHKCKPIKFVPEDITAKIVKEPNFKLWETVFGKKKVQRLTIFDSKNRKFGYVYSYYVLKKNYNCLECKKKNKTITAKLRQDENGQNYVELGKIEHVCKLQKL